MQSKAKLLLVGCLVALVLAAGSDALAKGSKKKGGKKGGGGNNSNAAQAQAQAAAAQAMIAAIKARLEEAQGALGSALSRVKAALSGLQGAKSSLRNAQLTMDEVERRILSAQSDDSEFAKAEKAFKRAKEKLKEEKERVLQGSAFASDKESAVSQADKDEAVFTVPKHALDNDSGYQAALRNYKETRATYESLKESLLKQDPDWANAAKTLADASAAEALLEARLQAGLVSEADAHEAIRELQNGAAKIAANKPPPSSSGKKSKKGKKK